MLSLPIFQDIILPILPSLLSLHLLSLTNLLFLLETRQRTFLPYRKVLQGLCVPLKLIPILSPSFSALMPWESSPVSVFISLLLLEPLHHWLQFSPSGTNVLKVNNHPILFNSRGTFQFLQWANSLPASGTVHCLFFLETCFFPMMLLLIHFPIFLCPLFSIFFLSSSFSTILKMTVSLVTPHGWLLFSVYSWAMPVIILVLTFV